MNENYSIINEENTKQNEDIKDEFIYHSEIETVVLFLLDKIISNVIHEVNNKAIYNDLILHCYKFTKNQINNLLITNFFFHDDGKKSNEQIFYNYIPQKTDKWFKIEEPKNPDNDRNNSNMVKIVSYKTIPNKSFYETKKNILIKNSNNSLNEVIELENVNSPKNKQINFHIKNRKHNIFLNKYKNINNQLIERRKIQQKNKMPIIELSYTDLEKEKYFNIFSEMNKNEEYNILRKEKEEEIIKKENERKINEEKRLFLEKTLKLLESNKNKKLPIIDGKGFTFDSNGKIIAKHLPSINTLKSDFIPVKSSLIEDDILNYKTKSLVNNNKLKSTGKKEINIKNEENNLTINNSMKNTNTNNLNNNKIFNKNKNIISKLNNDEGKKDEIIYKKLNMKEFKVTKSTRGNLSERNIKKRKIKIEYNPNDKEFIQNNEMKNKLENKGITPSGSNLKDIIPATGVVLKYNKFKKDGGFDYYKKYNKPSMNEFSKLAFSFSQSEVKDIFSLNNKDNFISNEKNNNNSNEIISDNEKNNNLLYNGYKDRFDDNNNPLIKNAHSLNKQSSQDNNRYIQNYSSVKPLNKSIKIKYMKNMLLSDNLRSKKFYIDDNMLPNSLSFQNNIQLSNQMDFDNLYNVFNELDDNNYPDIINKSNIKNNNINLSSNNLLKKNSLNIITNKKGKLPNIEKYNINKHEIFDPMVKFDLNIIKNIENNYWGNNNKNNELSINYPKRPALFSPKKLLDFKKIKKIRERKNILDKINSPEKINYEKLLVSKNDISK